MIFCIFCVVSDCVPSIRYLSCSFYCKIYLHIYFILTTNATVQHLSSFACYLSDEEIICVLNFYRVYERFSVFRFAINQFSLGASLVVSRWTIEICTRFKINRHRLSSTMVLYRVHHTSTR